MRMSARRRLVFYGVLALWAVVIMAFVGAGTWVLVGFGADMAATG